MKGGLDVKNGTILIEYIGQLRKEGQTLSEALIHAGRKGKPAVVVGPDHS